MNIGGKLGNNLLKRGKNEKKSLKIAALHRSNLIIYVSKVWMLVKYFLFYLILRGLKFQLHYNSKKN